MRDKKHRGGYKLSNEELLAQDDKSPCMMILKLNKQGEIIIDVMINKKKKNHTYTLKKVNKLFPI